jgi:N-methylhydantoinase B/oxoprolinase/acetone carboxylase alpha subunit
VAGGEDGKTGVNWIIRADGREEVLTGTATVQLDEGDTFVIETPGGGGYGNPA